MRPSAADWRSFISSSRTPQPAPTRSRPIRAVLRLHYKLSRSLARRSFPAADILVSLAPVPMLIPAYIRCSFAPRLSQLLRQCQSPKSVRPPAHFRKCFQNISAALNPKYVGGERRCYADSGGKRNKENERGRERERGKEGGREVRSNYSLSYRISRPGSREITSAAASRCEFRIYTSRYRELNPRRVLAELFTTWPTRVLFPKTILWRPKMQFRFINISNCTRARARTINSLQRVIIAIIFTEIKSISIFLN